MTGFHARGRRSRSWRLGLAGILVLTGIVALAGWYLDEAKQPPAEAAALRDALGVRSGMTVAEIGAGGGAIAVELARLLAPGGRVMATELDRALVETIARRARDAGVKNLAAVQAAERGTNLPDGCCDAIYMRRVYHDLTEPAAIVAALRKALKPGGRLVIIDFEPTTMGDALMPRRDNRDGHGIRKEHLLEELKSFGFAAIDGPRDWVGRMYIVVFRAVDPAR